MSGKSPVYHKLIAHNEYQYRKNIIKKIQKILDGKLITYTTNPGHPFANIFQGDCIVLEEMLRTTSSNKKGYLMVTSPGGDSDAAEKFLIMFRERFQEFNVIVPDYAKSAATMLALGSDKILMGYLAELGPIDPQLVTSMSSGQREILPARSFIDGLESIRKRVKDDGDPIEMYLPLLSQIRPELLARCERAISHSQRFAEQWLKKFQLKDNHEQAELVANLLSKGERYHSHGRVIDFREAKNELKLNVEKILPESKLWTLIWELYCRSAYFLQSQGPNAAKLFENDNLSTTMNVQVIMQRPPQQTQLAPRRPPIQPPLQTPEETPPSEKEADP